jgi:hypothetical protein
MSEKRTWIRPEIIVLIRSNPEESVLSGCKGGATDGPHGGFGLCHWYMLMPGCGVCQLEMAS